MRKVKCRAITLALSLGILSAWPAERSVAGEETAAVTQRVQVASVFVRRAFNEEAMVVVGFHTANDTVGQEQLLLEVAMTTLNNNRITINSSDVQLITPLGKTLPLMSQAQFQRNSTELTMLVALADTQNDSLNYLPKAANVLCPIRFFTDPAQGGSGIASDELFVIPEHACVGRLYFELPGGTEYGDYALAIKFSEHVLQVPFRLMTKDEAVEFRQAWKKKLKAAKKSNKKKRS